MQHRKGVPLLQGCPAPAPHMHASTPDPPPCWSLGTLQVRPQRLVAGPAAEAQLGKPGGTHGLDGATGQVSVRGAAPAAAAAAAREHERARSMGRGSGCRWSAGRPGAPPSADPSVLCLLPSMHLSKGVASRDAAQPDAACWPPEHALRLPLPPHRLPSAPFPPPPRGVCTAGWPRHSARSW